MYHVCLTPHAKAFYCALDLDKDNQYQVVVFISMLRRLRRFFRHHHSAAAESSMRWVTPAALNCTRAHPQPPAALARTLLERLSPPSYHRIVCGNFPAIMVSLCSVFAFVSCALWHSLVAFAESCRREPQALSEQFNGHFGHRQAEVEPRVQG
jgi:hypothetical protein